MAAKHFSNLVVDGRKARFDVSGIDLCIVNSLRRAIMSEVPTAAFPFDVSMRHTDDGNSGGVLMVRNSSCLNNEFVGHRVSLVPLGFDENQLHNFQMADYRFVLKVKNDSCEMRTVTTADFEVFDKNDARLPQSTRDMLFPPCQETGDHVLLLRLRPGLQCDGNGEEIHMECRAVLGTGRKHARWSPVSSCYFRNKVDDALCKASLNAKLEALSPADTDDLRVETEKQHAALDAHRCFMRDEYGDPVAFEFSLECEAPRLRPTYVVFKALSVLRSKLDAISASLLETDADESRVYVDTVPNMNDFYHVTVLDEDHTLGNMVQGLLYRRWVRDGMGRDVTYIGYFQPHPLENNIVFKIKCAVAGDDVRSRFAEGIAWASLQLNDLMMEWITFSKLDKDDIIQVKEVLLRADRKRTSAAAVVSRKK